MAKQRITVHFRDPQQPPISTVVPLNQDTTINYGALFLDMANGDRETIPLTSIQHITAHRLEETP